MKISNALNSNGKFFSPVFFAFYQGKLNKVIMIDKKSRRRKKKERNDCFLLSFSSLLCPFTRSIEMVTATNLISMTLNNDA
jgi:hypothetical protein